MAMIRKGRPVAEPLGLGGEGLLPNLYDLAIFILVAGVFVLIAHGAHEMTAPAARLASEPVTLDPANLPEYALRTTLRMFAAIIVSLLFTFVVATLAAKSRTAELVIVPALDILQSVPVLGFLTFTVVFFLRLFPGSEFGAECAAIFAIFTSQAWNMAFSFYQSLRTVPRDLDEVSRHFQLSPWLRFWRLEAPFAAPGLIWNTMMSMSGGWFFVVASEAITVGDTTIKLPGIGSWLAVAIDAKDIHAVILAVLAMAAVILAYDQLLFRPIVAWADKFRFEQTAAPSARAPGSTICGGAARWCAASRRPSAGWPRRISKLPLGFTRAARAARRSSDRPRLRRTPVAGRRARRSSPTRCGGSCCSRAPRSAPRICWPRSASACCTLLRVVVLIALASLVWVPIGVWIGLRPWAATRVQPVAQFLAAFPANVLFPMAVVVIVREHLDPDIWLSPLMVLGTQWYILFNVIAGASAFPTDLREVSTLFRLRTWQWWRKVIAARRSCRTTSPARSPRRAARGTPASWPRSRAGATPSSRPPASAPTSPMRAPPAIIRASCWASPSCR